LSGGGHRPAILEPAKPFGKRRVLTITLFPVMGVN